MHVPNFIVLFPFPTMQLVFLPVNGPLFAMCFIRIINSLHLNTIHTRYYAKKADIWRKKTTEERRAAVLTLLCSSHIFSITLCPQEKFSQEPGKKSELRIQLRTCPIWFSTEIWIFDLNSIKYYFQLDLCWVLFVCLFVYKNGTCGILDVTVNHWSVAQESLISLCCFSPWRAKLLPRISSPEHIP